MLDTFGDTTPAVNRKSVKKIELRQETAIVSHMKKIGVPKDVTCKKIDL